MKIEEIQDIFFQECDEGLGHAETGLLALQSGSGDDETINTIFRAVHSIKGGAGAFGFSALQNFTHHFETLLDQVRSGERPLTPDLVSLLLAAFDTLADHVGAIRGEKPMPEDSTVLAQLQAVVSGAPVEAAAEVEPAGDSLGFDLDAMIGAIEDSMAPAEDWEKGPADEAPAADAEDDATTESGEEVTHLFVRPLDGALANGGEPLLLLRELVDLGATVRSADLSSIPTIDQFDPGKAYIGWHATVPSSVQRSDIEEIFEFVSDCCQLTFDSSGPETQAEAPEAEVAEAVAVEAPVETVAPIAEQRTEPEPVEAAPAVAAAAPPPAQKSAPAAPQPVAKPVADAAADADKGGATAQAVGVTPTIRVDLEKLDRLVNLVGELVITQSMLAQRLLDCGLSHISELVDLDHLTRELQDSAMSIRAQPIRSVFGRVPRIVRELQASTGKRVVLELEGESTELDKTVVERIGDPLTHLIRNAVDHGLETPEERLAAGKQPEGRIKLSAEHRSGRILISVSDDGKGIDRERVLAKAIERGLVGPDAKLSNEEIDNLIFAAGFSTAQTVSNISGRGVGMDVVRRNISALGGRITISSRPGEGSTFTMALPLTLAILDGMIVTVGEQTFVLPLNHIVETLRPRADIVKSIGAGQSMLNVRGHWLPVLSVGRELSVPGARSEPTDAVLIVVESEETGRRVLMVDAILDQRQVVIKSLESNYGRVDGIAGATILGDGRVALILDVEAITSTIKHQIEPARSLAA
ncbi:chemotaxis protein CheA [Rhizorhabdus phycosphaerae]|uniref:chemotaxis protein CheA n=1 Tax=Rhizorhabdus phycosphaerae TaxID=2711156 RepID=UPI0013ED4710|nr:chemotaxis protein CheA [Rhizorhabdus phycosphaerae]